MAGQSHYIPLPAYEFPQNAMLDQNTVNGISRELAGIGQDKRDNAMLALQQQAGKRANAELGLRQQAGTREQTQFNQDQLDRQHKQLAATVQAISELPPEQQSSAWSQLRRGVPDFDKDLAAQGVDPNDHVAASKLIIARAQGYEDPIKKQMEAATLDKTRAETEALGRKDIFSDVAAQLLKRNQNSQPPPAAQPSLQPQSYSPPQPQGPMLQPISDATQPANALAPQPQPQPQNGLQLAGDDTTDEAKALPEPSAANPSAVYNLPGDAVINTPMGQMTRDDARKAGMALSMANKGDAGKMMMDAAGGGDQRIGRNGTAANDKEEMTATNALATMERVKSQFNGKFLTYSNKITQWGKGVYEKMGGTLNPQDKADLAAYTSFRQSSMHALNRVLKDLSGTAVTQNEMDRQLLDMPNAGLGVMDGDSPTVFAAKLKGTLEFNQAAIARSRYLRAQGFTGAPWKAALDGKIPMPISIEEMPAIINKRGAEIEQQLKQQNPKIDPGRLNTEVDKRVKQEFGI